MAESHDTSVREHRIRRDEYFRMIDAGVFDAREHIELVHGKLVVVVPQGPPHASTSTKLLYRLFSALGGRAIVRADMPLDCGDDEVPEPHLAVVRGRVDDYSKRHPRGDEVLLVVEIAYSSHALDRDKAAV